MAVPVTLSDLYAASYRRLAVQMLALCGDPAEAEDAVQEAFVSAIRRKREFAGVANPEAWLRTVAMNRLKNQWRHAAVVRRYAVLVPSPQIPVELGPEHVAVVAALGQLDVAQRQVVVLHHFADLSVGQIADELGIPAGTVKSRLARGRERLAALLDEREEESRA